MSYPKSSRGFTLVELLVAVGIIAILIAILLPVLNKVRAGARQAACASNLRQISMGFSLYRNDHNGFLPPVNAHLGNSKDAGYTYQGTARVYGMYNAIGPYVGMPQWGGLRLKDGEPINYDDPSYLKSDGYWGSYKGDKFRETVFFCPDSPKSEPSPWVGVSYGESLYLQYPAGDAPNTPGKTQPYPWKAPRRFGAIPSPSTAIHLADASTWYLGDRRFISRKSPDFDPTESRVDLNRHSGGTNVLFVDGHVTWYAADYITNNITYVTDKPSHDKNKDSMENFHLK